MNLNYKKPVTTKDGNEVKVYYIYSDYMHGAWYNEDRDWWMVGTWTLSGTYLGKTYGKNLDLVNV